MTVRPIVMWPEPWLKQKSVEVLPEEFGSPDLVELAEDLVETMQAARGLGISAPQIGVHKRIIVIPSPEKGWLTVCNPVVTPTIATKNRGQEGCLSLPGVALYIERHEGVRLEGRAVDGAAIAFELTGLAAIAAQHECDHLDGTTIAEHVGPAHQQLLRAKMKKAVRNMERSQKRVMEGRKAAIALARKATTDPDDYAFPSKPS